MKKIITTTAICLAVGASGFAQLGTPLSQFSGNQIAFNPGYAGIYEMLTLNLSVRKSWVQVPGSPSIISFNGHAPFSNERHSLGWVYRREEFGPLTENSGYGNYAFKVYMKQGILNFGVQAGFVNQSVIWTKVKPVDDPSDVLYDPDNTGRSNSTKFDAGTGIFFLTPDYYVGISARHISNPKFDREQIKDLDWYSQLPVNWFLVAGYHYDFDDYWSIRPELFMRYVHHTPLSVDVGLHAYYMNNYSLGVNYMTGQKQISFCARAMLTHNLRVGYSYDIYFGRVRPFQRGSHEIMISYYIKDIWWEKKNTERLLWQ
jgi:type IX secretion system PorP/SprF family membrane protein